MFQHVTSMQIWNKYQSIPIRETIEQDDELKRKQNYYKVNSYENLVSSEVYITDFGTAVRYLDKDGKHIKNIKTKDIHR